MIGIDTNILIRYLTQDHEQQAKTASDLLSLYNRKKGSIFLNNIVICELIWVLERGYKYSNKQITSTIRHILSIEEFNFEHANILWLSLKEYEDSKLDYSDIFIGKLNNITYRCNTTFSFDKNASTMKEFTLATSTI